MKRQIFFFLLAAVASAQATRAQAQIILIANSDMKVDSITKDDVRDVFTGASPNLRSGILVKPVLLTKGPAQNEFLASYVGITQAEFRSDWVGLLFAGKSFMPPSLESEAEVVEYVAHHASTIGYVHMSTPHRGVTVLVVK
jgi:hypothetical protein